MALHSEGPHARRAEVEEGCGWVLRARGPCLRRGGWL